MLCKKCSHDRFDTIRTYRERKFQENKWVSVSDCDTRMIICQRCGARYMTESHLTHKVEFDQGKVKKSIVKLGERG